MCIQSFQDGNSWVRKRCERVSIVGVHGQRCTAGSRGLGALGNPRLEHDPGDPPFTTPCLALPTGERACHCGIGVRMMNSMEKTLYLKSFENLELIILQGGTDKIVSNNECCREGMS